MKRKCCFIYKADCEFDDRMLGELRELIEKLINKKCINCFFIQQNDVSSEIIIKSIKSNLAIIKYSLKNISNENVVGTIKNELRESCVAIFVGITNNGQLAINCDMDVNHRGIKVYTISKPVRAEWFS